MTELSQIITKSFFKGVGQISGALFIIMIGYQIKNILHSKLTLDSQLNSNSQDLNIELDHEEINDEDVKGDSNKLKMIKKLFDKII